MKFSLYLALIFIGNVSFAQVAINSDNSAPHSSAQLEVKSANKGLLLPRVDPSAVANPTAGLFCITILTTSSAITMATAGPMCPQMVVFWTVSPIQWHFQAVYIV